MDKLVRVLLSFAVLMALASSVVAGGPLNSTDSENGLQNGSLEKLDEDGVPVGWVFPGTLSGLGYVLESDSESKVDGERSAVVDATEKTGSGFGLLNQILNPKPYLGRRVKFRAAVRTSERAADGKAQLWLRADQGRTMVAFDNMQARPITKDDWDYYEIVADIPETATGLIVGMIVIGKVKAWIDDASLQIVEDDVATTTVDMSARAKAPNAPPQPYYNHWLLLAGLVLVMFILSQVGGSRLQRFALHFTVLYWLVYSFPQPFSKLVTSLLGLLTLAGIDADSWAQSVMQWQTSYAKQFEALTKWTAKNVLGMEGELVSAINNGSGDTTVAYVQLLVGFFIALMGALVWSAVMFNRKPTGSPTLRDGLRTYLRWVLALTMLSYGLAKAGFIMTQFGGLPGEYQMERKFGDVSPMGLLWTFMAVSPAYTFFAGLGEVIGGILLVFRRTMTLGALVTFGVMLNVVMLNFCYDVPVKQYSFHLMVMAILIAMPDFSRLLNVLLFNRPTESTNLLSPPYLAGKSLWIYRALKSLAVITLVIVPVSTHVYREVTHEYPEATESEYLLLNRGFRWINESPFNR